MSFWKKVVLCVLVVVLLGNVSGLVTASAIGGWYDALVKPAGTPPNSVFGPVWVTLYVMIGVALALLWDRPESTRLKRRVLSCFALQFGLNLLWSPLFFGLRQIELAAVLIIVLLGLIAWTIHLARPISRTAATLMLPYLIWVSYATYLNIGFWVLNR